MGYLKDVKNVDIDELYEIIVSYNHTRIGSRQLYKLLELVVKFRLNDIKENAKIIKGIFVVCTKSGLMSKDVLDKL